MSEVLGRRKLFIGTYILFTIFNGGVIASQNIWTLIILRFLAGTAGSSPLTNAGGTVSDLLDAGERGLGMAIFAAAPFLGPAVGPIVSPFSSLERLKLTNFRSEDFWVKLEGGDGLPLFLRSLLVS
jgi:MFS family permease